MARQVLIEASITKKEGRSIEGVALIPMISLNDNLYTPGEIQHADGKVVPLNWEHRMSDVLNDVDIGTASFEYNWATRRLHYKAEITSDIARRLMQGEDYFVSIEAVVGEDRWLCNAEPDDCFHMPSGLEFVALAVTKTPGIPETTMESSKNPKFESLSKVYKQIVGTSGVAKSTESKNEIPPGYVFVEALGYAVPRKFAEDKDWVARMVKAAESKTTENEDEVGMDAGPAVSKPDVQMCPEGQKRVDGECVPADNTESAKPCGCESKGKTEMDHDDDDKDKDESKGKSEMDDDDDDKDKTGESTGHGMPNMDEIKDKVEAQAAKLAEYEKKLNARKEYKIARVTSERDGKIVEEDMATLATIGWEKLRAESNFNFLVDMGTPWTDVYAKPWNYKAREAYFRSAGLPAPGAGGKVGEAINFIGADKGNQLSLGMNIRIRPNGKYAKSIRDLVMVREFPSLGAGVNTIKEPISVPFDSQVETEGPAAVNAYATTDVHYVSLEANEVRGTPQFVNYSMLEDTPQQIFAMFTEASRIEALNQEAEIFIKATNDVATTGFNSLGRWISGDGAPITDDDDSDLGTITAQTIADVKEYYQREGYDTDFGSIKMAVSPEQFNALYNDPELDRYINQGAPDVRRTGDLVFVNGIEIIVMNAIRTMTATGARSNAAQRAFAFIPQNSVLLGIKRDMRVAILESPNRNGYDWNWTQRKNATVFDAKSICRVSTGV